jgi:hypothetical protein
MLMGWMMMTRSVHLEFGLGHIEHCMGRRKGHGSLILLVCEN